MEAFSFRGRRRRRKKEILAGLKVERQISRTVQLSLREGRKIEYEEELNRKASNNEKFSKTGSEWIPDLSFSLSFSLSASTSLLREMKRMP